MATEPVYNRIGKDYDVCRRADPLIADRILAELAAPPGARVLDIGCGSGNYSVAIQERGLQVVAVDISEAMLTQARAKSERVQWVQADAKQALPFDDREFLGAFSVLATHHIAELQTCFSEVFRCLDSGQFVIFTMTPEQMESYWENAYWPQAVEESIGRMASYRELETLLLQAGFRTVHAEKYEVRKGLQDRFFRCGKLQPELYLDPTVRAGISTFALASDQAEVEEGCVRLARDLESKHFDTVVEEHSSDRGDLLFVIATR